MLAGPAAVVALICGWITTEVGRQPWIVYRVMRVEEAVTGASGIPLGYATVARRSTPRSTVIAVVLLRRAGAVAPGPRGGGRRVAPAQGGDRVSLADWCGVLIVLGLTAYAVLGGADFGTGVWDVTAGDDAWGPAHPLQHRAVDGPGVGGQPRLADLRAGGVLDGVPGGVRIGGLDALRPAVPGGRSGIILRGTAFATRGVHGGSRAGVRGLPGALRPVIGAHAVLPGAVVGAVASGRVPVGNAAGDAITSWWNPTAVMVGALAVVTGAYLAAVYLAADARRVGEEDLAEAMRRRALGAGLVAGAMALGGLAVLRDDARALYDGLLDDGLPLVILTAVAGHRDPRRWSGAGATGPRASRPPWRWARSCGAGSWRQHPAFLPGELTIDEAAAGRPTLVALLVATALGAIVLVPSLALPVPALPDRPPRQGRAAGGRARGRRCRERPPHRAPRRRLRRRRAGADGAGGLPLGARRGGGALIAFIAIGAAAIATPEYLGRDDDWKDEEAEAPRRPGPAGSPPSGGPGRRRRGGHLTIACISSR